MGSARVGSNPILVEILFDFSKCKFLLSLSSKECSVNMEKKRQKLVKNEQMEKEFRYRESNPGHLGESQIS